MIAVAVAVVPHTVCVHLIEDVRRRSYDGPIYSEYEGAGDFLEGTRASIGFLRSILER